MLAAGTTACSFGVDFSSARFRCESSADCPVGLACVAGTCDLPAGEVEPPDGAPSGSELVVLRPVADTYIDEVEPYDNRGDSPELRVDGSPQAISFIRFGGLDLEEIEERRVVESATLEVYAQNAHPDGYQLWITGGHGWSETGVTFRDAPRVDAMVGGSGAIAEATWTSVDLAALMAEGDYESYALTTDSASTLSLASREAGDLAPRLVIVLAP